ncbi:MAG: GNAT family N-acetyltransferase [Archangiaceae bacterium]|nr:GNAT family N-acetyltransferase [Archangiaceae bacterium]
MTASEVGPATSRELPGLLRAWDEAFVLSKGRTLGFAQRLPGVFDAPVLENIVVARHDEAVIGAAVMKRLEWVSGGARSAFAAIGLVWTHEAHRGKGVASRVLERLLQRAETSGCAAAVLWTTLSGFYERLGFVRDDQSVIGIVTRSSAEPSPDGVSVAVASGDTVARRERIRTAWCAERVERSAADWRTLPLPCGEMVELSTADGYALVGVLNEKAYVYELYGPADQLRALWQSIRSRYGWVLVNDREGSASAAVLRAAGVVFERQALTLWKPLTVRERPHLPFLDRI